MNYISDIKLKFIIENFIKITLSSLKSAQLQGYFKTESYFLGQLDILKKLSNDLNLKIDVDKLISKC